MINSVQEKKETKRSKSKKEDKSKEKKAKEVEVTNDNKVLDELIIVSQPLLFSVISVIVVSKILHIFIK